MTICNTTLSHLFMDYLNSISVGFHSNRSFSHPKSSVIILLTSFLLRSLNDQKQAQKRSVTMREALYVKNNLLNMQQLKIVVTLVFAGDRSLPIPQNSLFVVIKCQTNQT
uniref:Uncharacterized protein n=1 Tax=Hyaloperonospora arabidopsidis (strain Emoy2) TaxID=559515 RepID=M4BPE2_HYAAE